MRREVNLDDISDGRLYSLNDLVKSDCHDCKECSACCRGMGNSIILDPLDVNRILTGLNRTFTELLAEKAELNVIDGIILPNLKMSESSDCCEFLNHEDRCSIHGFRPGICRLFPLGRYYDQDTFQYFLQIHECKADKKTKIKVRKWIDTPDIKRNEKFIIDWHNFVTGAQATIKTIQDDAMVKTVNIYILNSFYIRKYEVDRDFYVQFNERLVEAKNFVASTAFNDYVNPI